MKQKKKNQANTSRFDKKAALSFLDKEQFKCIKFVGDDEDTIFTYVKEYRIDRVIGESWSYFARAQFRQNADLIVEMLRKRGETVRITEEREGQKYGEILKPIK